MSIKWAPIIDVDMERRLQVLSAFSFFMLIYFGELFCLALFVLLVVYGGIAGRVFCMLYFIYVFFDFRAPEDGRRGQGNKTSRRLLLRHFTSYFPIKLVKTAELKPTRNYLFAAFPHGVMSASFFGNFASSTTNFSLMFPKIRSKFCTLSSHFYFPFFRDLFLSWGMISVQSSSIKNALLQSNDSFDQNNSDGFTSNAVVIAVGGSQEVVYARPGDYCLYLKNRKGFIKVAIQTGASIVPVFSFGEIDIYDQPTNEPGTKFRRFQEICKNLTGIVPPIVIGRGFFQYSFGVIPRRYPITTVVGAPIEVVRHASPTDEAINDLHEVFIAKLKKLFADHKAKYSTNPDAKLIIEG